MNKLVDLSASSSRRTLAVVGLTLLVVAINLLLAWRNDVDLRQHALENAESDGHQVLTAFADHAVQLLDYGDSHLRTARAIYGRLGGSEDFREFLAATKGQHSESHIVSTVFSDHSGQIVFDSERRQIPSITAAGLDYFRYFQTHDDDVPYIDPTRFGRLWQQYHFRIVRRLSRNGQFDGVAILNMRPEGLANFTRQFELGPHATYAILNLDRKLIVRQPAPDGKAYGESQDDLGLWRSLEAAPTAGKYWASSPFDGRKRLLLYSKLSDYPLVVLVGLDEQDMLDHQAAARTPNVRNAAAFTIVTCILCLLVVLVQRKSSALERANSTLELSEGRLARAMDATSDGLWEWDVVTGHGYFSPAYYRMLGYEEGEFSSAAESWLELIYPEDRERALAANQDCIDNRVESFAVEFRMRAKDGSWRWILGRGKAVTREASGKALRMVGTHVDITERKQSEREMTAARAAAELANRAKSEFLANMSHEIRTPLNGLMGNVQLLEMTELTGEQREYLSTIMLSGNNLLSLINDILDLSKIEAEKLTLEHVDFSLRGCVNDLVRTQRSRIGSKRLSLKLDIPREVPDVLVGDPLRIKQILLNLLGNAIKFTNEGGITVSAAIKERHDHDALIELSVADTGVGMPDAVAQRIFEPFVQADDSIARRYGGTGLGLAICRRLTELMGGSIAVESAEGAGSTFRVLLPFTILEHADQKHAIPGAPPQALWTGPAMKILLAEDNEINQQFSVALLKKMGHQVVVAENGKDALAALGKDAFDLVLMDIQMPVMNGNEVLAELREREQTTDAHLPVIALTAYALKGDEEKYLAAGFDGYVSKPLEVRKLVVEMKRALEPRGEASSREA